MSGAGALAARLLATFVEELDEQVRVMNADLIALEGAPCDPEHLKSLFRVAHTLKGAARAAGVMPVERACHDLEARLAGARDGREPLDPTDLEALFGAADALAEAGAALRRGEDLTAWSLATTGKPRRAAAGRRSRAVAPAASRPVPPATRQDASRQRVDPARLDAVTAAAGQLLVAAGGVAQAAEDVHALHEFALAWSAEWRRAGRALRLACERADIGAAAGPALHAVEENLRRLVRDTGTASARSGEATRKLSRASGEVGRSVHRLRLRPFADACEALPRAVRDLAAAAGKQAQLVVTGGDVEADRAVVDGLREALLHLVRNAVDHGIEAPAARERAGKARAGTVRVAAALSANRLQVTVEDDGAGLDTAAIRRALARQGRPAPDDDADLAQQLFAGGISTRAEATEISGRGVGLDLVRTAVERLHGTVSVRWTRGRGTAFRIECPPSLVSIRAVVVEAGAHRLVLPSDHVLRLVRAVPDHVRQVEGRAVLATGEGPVPLVSLARLLGPPLAEKPAGPSLLVVLLGDGERRAAVVVDELVGEQEIVLRPAGRDGAAKPRFVAGATILATGRVAPVLDAAAVLDAALAPDAGAASAVMPAAPAGPRRRRILVVDDSITTRTLEQSVLEAAGYEVRTAVDGDDAWKALQEHGCDLVVADIEMPRMDGFALCEAIRGAKRFRELPVVLVTALETPEHRARGLEVGADAYIGKSSFDQQALLETIRQLLGAPA